MLIIGSIAWGWGQERDTVANRMLFARQTLKDVHSDVHRCGSRRPIIRPSIFLLGGGYKPQSFSTRADFFKRPPASPSPHLLPALPSTPRLLTSTTNASMADHDSNSMEKHDSSIKEHASHEEVGPGGIIIRENSFLDDDHIKLTWRSWLVVFVACFGILYVIDSPSLLESFADTKRHSAQVFVVVAAGSVIAFIIRDVGDAPLAGWIIQAPLLMQSVLSPIIGRLSDVVDRKYLSSIPPMLAFIGAIVRSHTTLFLDFA